MCCSFRLLLTIVLLTKVTSIKEYSKRMTNEEMSYYFDNEINEDADDIYQVVYLPTRVADSWQQGDDSLEYDLHVFGSQIKLNLTPNKQITSPDFRVIIRDGQSNSYQHQSNCHYMHRDRLTLAAISLCQHPRVHGFIFLPNETLEIQPLESQEVEDRQEPGIPHVVKRASLTTDPTQDHDDVHFLDLPQINFIEERVKRRGENKNKQTVELALFFDEAGYKTFSPYFDYDDQQLVDMLLAYVNGVQALYHHPSLGNSIDLVLVRLEILKKQPSDLPHYNGERTQLLDSFCLYNEKHNTPDDNNKDHWDMGLYVSGLDFFAYESGRKSGVTMGLATVGGVCLPKYNCIIAELGATNVFGKPYPSAGFTSVFILAHEIGHNLGMHHDGVGNNCPKEGYIMSPSRGTNGETQWSSCSAGVASSMSWAKCLFDKPGAVPKDRNHARYQDQPGQSWGAKKQCEILLRDRDAVLNNPDKLQGICENLQCRTPHRSGFYFAGPALEGTSCGRDMWCQGGYCTKMRQQKPDKVIKGGWSEWQPSACQSGCTVKSRGYQTRRRTCTNPRPVNTDEGCEGMSFDTIICKDDKVCKKKKRQSAIDYATEKCKKFGKLIPELDTNASGLQAPHEEGRLWMGCAVFCRRKDTGSYYTPRLELNDLGVDPYFPDGTWCHSEGKNQRYCLQHHCLPEDFIFTKGVYVSEDVPLPQNAPPIIKPYSDEIIQYLSLDQSGKPIRTTLKPGQTNPPAEEEWSDKDYIEI